VTPPHCPVAHISSSAKAVPDFARLHAGTNLYTLVPTLVAEQIVYCPPKQKPLEHYIALSHAPTTASSTSTPAPTSTLW
jgi:hypothetical protein